MICIVDLDVGNLANVKRALGGNISSDPALVEQADKIVLPGVGNFGSVSEEIESLRDVIVEGVEEGKPILGICLGMHLLFEDSDEGRGNGLGILKGEVRRFREKRTPHIGWNTVNFNERSKLFEGIGENEYFYFAHSYRAYPEDEGIVVGRTERAVGGSDETFPSIVQKDNFYGTQFHPEKSGIAGRKLLNNFKERGAV
ncbi:MAG: imidazole glycerol phosphate synthase subunit HisH [Thermoplasmata archaeon]